MAYDFENKKIDANIKLGTVFKVHMMEDYYLFVTFRYPKRVWNGCIPLQSKYQGINIPPTIEDVYDWAKKCYVELDPEKNAMWQNAQRTYWQEREAFDTQAVFDALNGDEVLSKWMCRKCGPVPAVNPQAGARVRDLRKAGYFVATTKMQCGTCGKSQFFDLLVRLPRQAADNQKRYTIAKSLEKKIKETLPDRDACFGTPLKDGEKIIDHKFPSSRWVNGETVNETTMTEEEIQKKFQILTNQTNLQKERYCQRCVIKGVRGDFFGIEWFYEGDKTWKGTSKADEEGCVGCPWYDMEEWKKRFNAYLSELSEMVKKEEE